MIQPFVSAGVNTLIPSPIDIGCRRLLVGSATRACGRMNDLGCTRFAVQLHVCRILLVSDVEQLLYTLLLYSERLS